MKSKSQKFEDFQRNVLENLAKTNEKLDKICAILISNQLLQECISPEGQARSAEQCAEIVNESFCAGMCLSEELNTRTREFDYQKSEFFVEDEEEEEVLDEFEEDEDDDEPPSRPLVSMKF
jgi:hypothetical protein